MLREFLEAVVRPPFWAAARVLHKPTFHPRGVLLTGTFRPADSFSHRTAADAQVVTARLSKGLGTPGSMRDVLGLAFRIVDADGEPWDFVLATVGTGSVTRYVFTTPRSWSRARFGSLMHYQFDDGESHQIFAIPESGFPNTTALADLRRSARVDSLTLRVTADPHDGPEIGRLELRLPDSDENDEPRWFDPVVHRPANVQLLPSSIAEAREQAYAASRSGRKLQR